MNTLSGYVIEYLKYLEIEKNLSENTITSYAFDLQAFCNFLESSNSSLLINIKNIDSTIIRHYILTIRSQGIKINSMQRHMSAIRGMFDFIVHKKIISSNPCVVNLPKNKSDNKLPKVLNPDEIINLLNQDTTKHIDLRDITIMELFYSTGLRLSELANLTLKDIKLASDDLLVITGKGNKQRKVPFGSFAKDKVFKWLKVREEYINLINKDISKEYLFITLTKPYKKLSVRSIQDRLNKWGIKLGLDIKLHPHIFRHSSASHFLESCESLPIVQEFLGHSNLATTQIYTKLNFQYLADVYDRAHPRAKK